jgi:hypothetical protein
MSDKQLPEVDLSPAGFTPTYGSLGKPSKGGKLRKGTRSSKPIIFILLFVIAIALGTGLAVLIGNRY